MDEHMPPTPDRNAIRTLTMDDLDALVRFHCEYLNYGEGIRPHFSQVLRDETAVALKYMVGEEIAGIVIFTPGITLSGDHRDLEERLLQFAQGKKVYTGDAVLVRQRFRRKGISEALRAEAERRMRRMGAQFVLHELWVYPNGLVPAARHVDAYSWSYYLGRFKNFYKDFNRYGYLCPICGDECKCAAQIYLCSLYEPEGWIQ